MKPLAFIFIAFLTIICLALPGFLSFSVSLDQKWLLEVQLELIGTSGTMASISLAMLSLPFIIGPERKIFYQLWMRFLIIVSIMCFLLASVFGLAHSFVLSITKMAYLFLNAPFWYIFCGVISLILLTLILFASRSWWEEV